MHELETALKLPTTGKSRDHEFLKCDIFKENVIGDDLNVSIVMMLNRMKEQTYIPSCFKTSNITMLHKKKNKLDLTNWRGIFVTSVLRILLMKMIHNRTYKVVETNMTDSQIGARKHKSVRNHIFVLNSIVSDVMSSHKKNLPYI